MRFLWIGSLVVLLAVSAAEPRFQQTTQEGPRASPELRAVFEHRYSAWTKYIAPYDGTSSTVLLDAWAESGLQSPGFQHIVELGPEAVPFMVHAIEDNGLLHPASLLSFAVAKITRKSFGLTPEEMRGHFQSGDEIATLKRIRQQVLDWWTSRPQTSALFESAYGRWKVAKKKGIRVLEITERTYDAERNLIMPKATHTDLGLAYQALRELGIEALPLIAEKVKGGEHDLLPLFAELSDSRGITERGSLPERANSTLQWWEKHKHNWLLPSASAAKLKDPKP